MEFKLDTSGYFYKDKKDHENLKKLGFKFNGNMIDRFKTPTININTLTELLEFIKKYGTVIIDEESIEIYDNCRE